MAWEDYDPRVKLRSLPPKIPELEGNDKGMRIRFNPNYLVSAGAEQGCGSFRGESGWWHVTREVTRGRVGVQRGGVGELT